MNKTKTKPRTTVLERSQRVHKDSSYKYKYKYKGPPVKVAAASCLGKGRIGGEVKEFQPLDRPVWPQPPAPLTPFQHKPDQTYL
jgi:hypothetical protein